MVFVEQSGKLGLDSIHMCRVYNALQFENEKNYNWSISKRNWN